MKFLTLALVGILCLVPFLAAIGRGIAARVGAVVGANNMAVYQALAREAAAIFEENAPFCSTVNRAREQDFDKKYDSYKPGATVNITVPPTATVYTGPNFAGGGSAEDTIERTVPVTFNDATDRKHVALSISTFEKVFNVPDAKSEWVDRFLRPKIASLASAVEADMIARAVKGTNNLVGTAGSPITAMLTVANARAKLQRSLAPKVNRSTLISDVTNVGLVDANKGIFNPSAEISKEFQEGYIGYGQGAQFYECVNLPAITNGSKVAGVTVNGTGSAGNTLNIGGVAGADTFKKGQVFTIAGVYAVHPLTGAQYGTTTGDLQQFVITADATMGGTTGSISIYPALQAAMPNQTISAAPAAGAALTFVGSASTAYRQNLMFHRDAYTVAMMPLPVIASCEGYSFSAKGFNLRVMTFGNGQTDTESTRIDVLATLAAVRGEHGCRITE